MEGKVPCTLHIHTMVADVLVTKGVRALATMVLTLYSLNILVSVLEGFADPGTLCLNQVTATRLKMRHLLDV